MKKLVALHCQIQKTVKGMISNSDLEKAWFLYKTEYEPQNISINDFCMRKGIPYREFNKWFCNTHKQVVPLEVEGAPEAPNSDQTQPDAVKVSNTSSSRKSGIHVFIHTSDGLQIQKKGLTYQGLLSLVEKLEGLC